ncbi:flagellar hook-length control protein FliK [Uliginosibacterium sp. H1]|uniref:flagellar hook-length control protein FliK n=1 Tax=Uliginosibacterium sp. H1 TaxID=3114757 RepID=UPI002E1894A4|nr:flagellar hook-length control protein FliK [Uliginosibacterium sp. H1]
MIPADLATRLRELIASQIQPLTASTSLASELPDFELGQRFNALIQSPLPDGTFKALVAGRNMTLALPESAKEGDVLELVVTERPKADGTVTARLAEPAAQAQPRPQLSHAGQIISQLLTGRHSQTDPEVQLNSGKPLVDTSPAAVTPRQGNASSAAETAATPNAQLGARLAAQLAPALRQAVSQSGLFYESHQARWVDGELPLESLLKEPQAQARLASTSAGGPLPDAAAEASAQDGTQPGGQAAPLRDTPALRQQAALAGNDMTTADEAARLANGDTTTTGTSAESARGAARMPESVGPIVHQQLDALATQQATWTGQVWPGQIMHWTVEDPRGGNGGQGGDGQQGSDEEFAAWKSDIRMLLPGLGGLDAQLILTPAGLALRITAPNPEAIATMRAHQNELATALEAAGVPLTGMSLESPSGSGT